MGDYRFHAGIDIAAEPGTVVRAAHAGTVTAVRRDPRFGWVMEITYAPGVLTRYAGLARVRVEQGTVVRAGDPVAELGEPAAVESAQPPHLHLELIWHGLPRDPAELLTTGS
jgi:murein DD-endopeptidase MepM/ murein hydrolase activator NlpD